MNNTRKRKRTRDDFESDTFNENITETVVYNFSILNFEKKIKEIVSHNKSIEKELKLLKDTNLKLIKDNSKLKSKIKKIENNSKKETDNQELKDEIEFLTNEIQNLLNEVRTDKNNSLSEFSYIS